MAQKRVFFVLFRFFFLFFCLIYFTPFTNELLSHQPAHFITSSSLFITSISAYIHFSFLFSCLPVIYGGKVWFYTLLRKNEGFWDADFDSNLCVKMLKPGCGIFVETKDGSMTVDTIHPTCLTELVKEFGVVVLRSFIRGVYK